MFGRIKSLQVVNDGRSSVLGVAFCAKSARQKLLATLNQLIVHIHLLLDSEESNRLISCGNAPVRNGTLVDEQLLFHGLQLLRVDLAADLAQVPNQLARLRVVAHAVVAVWMHFAFPSIVLVHLKATPLAVQNFVRAVACNVLLELLEGLCGARRAHKRTPDNHVAFTLHHVIEPILQLEHLAAMPALNSDLIDDVVQIAVLFFWNKWAFTLAAARAALGKPLGDTLFVENLFTVAALNRAERDTQTDWAHKRVDKTPILLLNVLFAEFVRLVEHVFNQVFVDARNE